MAYAFLNNISVYKLSARVSACICFCFISRVSSVSCSPVQSRFKNAGKGPKLWYTKFIGESCPLHKLCSKLFVRSVCFIYSQAKCQPALLVLSGFILSLISFFFLFSVFGDSGASVHHFEFNPTVLRDPWFQKAPTWSSQFLFWLKYSEFLFYFVQYCDVWPNTRKHSLWLSH